MTTVVEHRPVPLPNQQPPGGVAGLQGPGAVPGDGRLPQGAAQFAAGQFYNAAGQIEVKARGVQVPVDGNGKVTHVHMMCPSPRNRCEPRWVTAGSKTPPLCPGHGRPFVAFVAPSRLSAVLPWRDLAAWGRGEVPPLCALAAAALAGYVAEAGDVYPLAPLAATPLVFEASRRGMRWLKRKDPLRDAVDRAAREVGYCTAAGCGWLSVAAGLGMDSPVSWVSLLAVWAPAAGTWWKRRRDVRNAPPAPSPVVEMPAETEVAPVDADEQQTLQIWRTVVARKVNSQTGDRGGKLAGTWLEDWHRVEGGWGATICSRPGDYTSETFLGARGAIASAFRMRANMITVIPDVDDETRAEVFAQRTSPIADVVRWAGPKSINMEKGVAPVAQYADGTWAMYEVYRPGWGCPHDFLCGTTGAGKSETLSTLLLIDRWANGLVADLLIDPQQGQSYGPFLDELAAPVATSPEEAMLLVQAVRAEMLRRNRFLAQVPWEDPRRRNRDGSPVVRKGRKWWNPLIDGPILTVNIDEAHEYLAIKEFGALVTSGARMYRKCGIRIRVATHTPLLSDLGGSMALRSMLTGGFVWVGRTADALSGAIAFNGRLPVDPRTIEDVPGLGFVLSKINPKPMKARTMWEPDYYDWVRNDFNEPIGYPADLPQVTLDAFGPEFAGWVSALRAGGDWTPQVKAQPQPEAVNPKSVDAVLAVLDEASAPLDIDQIDAALKRSGTPFGTRTIRDALKKLGDHVLKDSERRYALTVEARMEAADELAVASEQASLLAAELAGVE